MWTRTYLLLLAVRLYFALAPSYIHPDENFQGPEVIAGNIFSFPHHQTWEFTSSNPVRSVFPLWIVYGLPMLILKGIWLELGKALAPEFTYYTLRVLMFILSFVLEDWAIHELVQSPRHRRLAVTLVASSYVTWTYQTHTFSNSIETLAVLWSLVMIQRILDDKARSSVVSSAILGSILTFGVFNRVTFPAFTLLPTLYLLPHFYRRPFSLLALVSTAALTALLALTMDTTFYNPTSSFRSLLTSPTITPLNSLLYNTSASNLASHGLHPHYQHLLASLPLLLGPALLLLPTMRASPPRLPIIAAASGTLLLSAIPHQEARFLLPVVPLFLSSIHLPRSKPHTRYWLGTWIAFNLAFGVLMGVFHQGGVIPTQIWVGKQHHTPDQGEMQMNLTEVLWWRTYSPPIYLLDHSPVQTSDLMGLPLPALEARIQQALSGKCDPHQRIGLVAPWSSTDLDTVRNGSEGKRGLVFEERYRWGRHLNLDDLDIPREGWLGTLGRVLGRPGLVVWEVGRVCDGIRGGGVPLGGDW